MDEKLVEKIRYDERADSLRQAVEAGGTSGASSVPLYLRQPYLVYENAVGRLAKPGISVLEIGSGICEFTGVALKTGALVVATDISEESLALVKRRYHGYSESLQVRSADMESFLTLVKRRQAIEPVIGHLKDDCGLRRNLLK